MLLNFKCLSDYFIAGIRKKVDDLCGCNEEMVRPLNELPPFATRSNRNLQNSDVTNLVVNPSHKNFRNSEQSAEGFKNQSDCAPQNNLKPTTSHSI